MSLRNSVWRSTSERRRTKRILPMMSESESLPRGTGWKTTTAPANVVSGLNKFFLLQNDLFLFLQFHQIQDLTSSLSFGDK